MINFACITPHPPIIIPGIGREEDLKKVENTVLAMEKLGRDLEESDPDTIIIISPHAPIADMYAFGINSKHHLEGNLENFGLDETLEFKNNPEIIEKINQTALVNDIPVYFHKEPLDHGSLVPLHYLTRNIKPRIVHLSFSYLGFPIHYHYGQIIGKICAESSDNIAIVASGDLSHRLTFDAPAGYSPRGKEFDEKLINLLAQEKDRVILELNHDFVEEAGECGLRSIIILLGALKEKERKFNILSYEGPFGVGYLTARLI